MLSPRRRVEIALAGGTADRVPFTIYECMIPQCQAEREMRNRGLCIVHRGAVFKTHRPNVTERSETLVENGKRVVRTWYKTPQGTLTTVHEPAGFTSWWHEKMFKTPDDFKAILAFVQDEQYEPDYGPLAAREAALGTDGICRASFGLEPLQMLISSNLMRMEDFCLQWMDNRDELLKIYNVLVEKRRQIYPIVAQSPISHANYGGNVVVDIIGLKAFEDYYVPHYNEAAEAMHRQGKRIGCHFDADCGLMAKAIAGTALDYIEAFTPAPDTDMTLGEARRAWPDKALWINFPSSVHLKPDAEVEQTALDLLNQTPSSDGILFGITEDIPDPRWRGSCAAIMDGLERHAKEKPGRYRPGAE